MSLSTDFFSGLFSSDPIRWLQGAVIVIAIILIYLLLYTLRDILLRTRSFWYQFFCVLLVGCVPVVGFFLYLLIRPARTVKDREVDAMLRALTGDEEGAEDAEAPDDADDHPEVSEPSYSFDSLL